jgi:hypothetical protein
MSKGLAKKVIADCSQYRNRILFYGSDLRPNTAKDPSNLVQLIVQAPASRPKDGDL